MRRGLEEEEEKRKIIKRKSTNKLLEILNLNLVCSNLFIKHLLYCISFLLLQETL